MNNQTTQKQILSYKTFSHAYIALFDSKLKEHFNQYKNDLFEIIENENDEIIKKYKERHENKEPENFWILLSYIMANYFKNNIKEIEKKLNITCPEDKIRDKDWLDDSDSVSSPWLSFNKTYKNFNNLGVEILFKISPCMLLDEPPNYSKIIIIIKHNDIDENFST